MLQYIKSKIHEILDGAYYVGIVENANKVLSAPQEPLKVHWITTGNYKGGWFADPFILRYDNDTITLLVEEYEYKTCKGILSEIIVDRTNYNLLNRREILRLKTHLSFPHFIKENDTILITPENADNSEFATYSYSKNGTLQKNKVLIEGELLDAQITKTTDGQYFVFAVKKTKEGLDATRQLYIFRSNNLLGPYYEIQRIDNRFREERGAGLIFEYNNTLLRPAQICEGGYGKGIILYQLLYKDSQFTEVEFARFVANPMQKNGLCLHTFSVHQDLIAVDGFDYKYRRIAAITPFVYKVKNVFNKLLHKK